jgi:Predicted transcriptional regulator with C-terminal CBS domains
MPKGETIDATHMSKFILYCESYRAYQSYRALVAPFSGECVRYIRKELNLSQRGLAVLCGVTFTYICKVEKRLEPIAPELGQKMLDLYREHRENEIQKLAESVRREPKR